MNILDYRDYIILFGTIAAIALYGIIRTRGKRNLHDYLRGKKQSWFVIGLSVMATQASAITFLSTPGQGYASGMGFIQNYFAVPLALVIIAAFFLPVYRKLNVYTAYEYLGNRFDKKTRLLAAAIFLLNRGIGAGYTIYAPAIVLSTVFGWSLTATIISSSVVVTIYTVAGGSDAVTHTQKYQLAIIIGGMITAFFILLSKIPCSFSDALTLAGHFDKLHAVDFTPNLKNRYTFWSGMLAGIFLMLSYFGTDQSQVQRYISGDNLRESRLGLMFNALFKIPMQFGILLLGVMLFVFYQFHPAPMFFNPAMNDQLSRAQMVTTNENRLTAELGNQYDDRQDEKIRLINEWIKTARSEEENDSAILDKMARIDKLSNSIRLRTQEIMSARASRNSNDNDYVFITFIKDNLPHGLIGLLIASFFLAALSSKAAELNALASCTTVDLYRHLIKPSATDRQCVIASKLFTAMWGLIALLFALFCNLSENLIQATNIIASLFYPILLSLFIVGFFLKFISGTPVFIGALAAQALVLALYFAVPDSTLSYLWYNPIGVAACITVATILQPFIGKSKDPPGFPVITRN